MINTAAKLLLLTLTLWGGFTYAGGYGVVRQIQFGWEAVEGASGYDIEFKNSNGKSLYKKTKHSLWQGKLEIDKYEMRIRSRDARQVPGDWSEWMPLTVKAPQVKITKPLLNQKLKSKGLEKTNIRFEWQKLGNIKEYLIAITNETGEITEHSAENTSAVIALPVGQKYTWSIVPVLSDLGYKAPETSTFEISGGRLQPPDIHKIDELAPIRSIYWSQPKHAKAYDVILLKKGDTAWSVDRVKKNVAEPYIEFDEVLSPGQYQVRVRASAPRFAKSSFEKVRFTAFTSRQPASVDTLQLKKKPRKNFYWHLSYMATLPKYSSVNLDSNFKINFDDSSPLGGTGELGFGYDSVYDDWTGRAMLSLSGFSSKNSKNSFDLFNYAAAEIEGGKKYKMTHFSILKPVVGVFYRQLPLLNGEKNDEGDFLPNGSHRISYTGLSLGADYTGHLTSILGYRTNLKLYLPLMTNNTSNGQAVKSDLNYEYGIMGSYQLTSRSTGFLGYTYKNERIRYPATRVDGLNTVELQGHYLNLVIESDY